MCAVIFMGYGPWSRTASTAAIHLGMNQAGRPVTSDESRMRYRRIAPLYDLLELPFEYARYRPLRRMLFADLTGRILDAGVGSGRNIPFYPAASEVIGIDSSPEMLARAERRRDRLGGQGGTPRTRRPRHRFSGQLIRRCGGELLVLRAVGAGSGAGAPRARPGVQARGEIRLLEYTRPQAPFRRLLTRVWEPWVRWAYNASFDRDVARNVPAAGLELVDARFVVDELVQYAVARPRA